MLDTSRGMISMMRKEKYHVIRTARVTSTGCLIQLEYLRGHHEERSQVDTKLGNLESFSIMKIFHQTRRTKSFTALSTENQTRQTHWTDTSHPPTYLQSKRAERRNATQTSVMNTEYAMLAQGASSG